MLSQRRYCSVLQLCSASVVTTKANLMRPCSTCAWCVVQAGAGFGAVGAMEEAKRALREAVQLPLQHPELFAKGMLAQPCKGVLLFGPPGAHL